MGRGDRTKKTLQKIGQKKKKERAKRKKLEGKRKPKK